MRIRAIRDFARDRPRAVVLAELHVAQIRDRRVLLPVGIDVAGSVVIVRIVDGIAINAVGVAGRSAHRPVVFRRLADDVRREFLRRQDVEFHRERGIPRPDAAPTRRSAGVRQGHIAVIAALHIAAGVAVPVGPGTRSRPVVQRHAQHADGRIAVDADLEPIARFQRPGIPSAVSARIEGPPPGHLLGAIGMGIQTDLGAAVVVVAATRRTIHEPRVVADLLEQRHLSRHASGGDGGLIAGQRRAAGQVVHLGARPAVFEDLDVISRLRIQARQREAVASVVVADFVAVLLIRRARERVTDARRRRAVRRRPVHRRAGPHHDDAAGAVAFRPAQIHRVGPDVREGETAGLHGRFRRHRAAAARGRAGLPIVDALIGAAVHARALERIHRHVVRRASRQPRHVHLRRGAVVPAEDHVAGVAQVGPAAERRVGRMQRAIRRAVRHRARRPHHDDRTIAVRARRPGNPHRSRAHVGEVHARCLARLRIEAALRRVGRADRVDRIAAVEILRASAQARPFVRERAHGRVAFRGTVLSHRRARGVVDRAAGGQRRTAIGHHRRPQRRRRLPDARRRRRRQRRHRDYRLGVARDRAAFGASGGDVGRRCNAAAECVSGRRRGRHVRNHQIAPRRADSRLARDGEANRTRQRQPRAGHHAITRVVGPAIVRVDHHPEVAQVARGRRPGRGQAQAREINAAGRRRDPEAEQDRIGRTGRLGPRRRVSRAIDRHRRRERLRPARRRRPARLVPRRHRHRTIGNSPDVDAVARRRPGGDVGRNEEVMVAQGQRLRQASEVHGPRRAGTDRLEFRVAAAVESGVRGIPQLQVRQVVRVMARRGDLQRGQRAGRVSDRQLKAGQHMARGPRRHVGRPHRPVVRQRHRGRGRHRGGGLGVRIAAGAGSVHGPHPVIVQRGWVQP